MRNVYAMYFSPTGTTKKITEAVAEKISALNAAASKTIDFTLPEKREINYTFCEGDVVVFGVPVYAGRVPNILLKFIATVRGNNAVAVPIVVFGNRNYDDALIELKTLMEGNGFTAVGAAAFVGEHSFSKILAQGRPDTQDMKEADLFADKISAKLENGKDYSPLYVKGEIPIRPYYQPRDRQGNHVDIRKVKPKTNDKCTNCGLCAEVCPMGSIDKNDVREYVGICIKCGACIKKCPAEAKYYDDGGYLYHKTELEEEFKRRAEVELFL